MYTMTYGELKREIKSLGFEDDSTIQEYNEIIIDATNRSLQYIFDNLVVKLKGYYKFELSNYEVDPPIIWMAVRPQKINEATPNDHLIDLPENLLELVPLLCSYYVWLDDDITKATYYWNMFDTYATEILNSCLRDVKGKVMSGGVRW